MIKKHETATDNPSIRTYINKIDNRMTFKIKSWNYLQLLTLEAMKLSWSTKSEITKDKNGENVTHLEITEIILVHCNIFNKDYQQNSRFLYTFFPSKSSVQSLDISPKNFIFLKTFNSDFFKY